MLYGVCFFFFFFFKQKTAYEIGWCDWSSDVCSSDLWRGSTTRVCARRSPRRSWRSEERRVGKSVPSSVDLGGRRIIKKKKKKKKKNEKNKKDIGGERKTKKEI